MHAPTFEQIAPKLVELLASRVIVAHNATFDTGYSCGALPTECRTTAGLDERIEYLTLLDRCLLDHRISRREVEALVGLAGDLVIGRGQATELNRRYVDVLVQVAWEDGVVTIDNRADVAIVAASLQNARRGTGGYRLVSRGFV